MAKRTLINRACKHILNSSVESNAAVVAAFNQTTDNDYEREEVKASPAPKQTFKEKYGIKPENVVEEQEPAQEPEAETEAEGPENFDDSYSDSDSFPNSEEYKEDLF